MYTSTELPLIVASGLVCLVKVKGSSSKDLKNAMEYRKVGDQAFTKLKKGELFEDIAEKASRETAGNRARTITGEIKKLANNPKSYKASIRNKRNESCL